MENDRITKLSHKRDGSWQGFMEIDKKTGDILHTFQDGGAHIDKANGQKLKIIKLTGDGKIKDLGPYF